MKLPSLRNYCSVNNESCFLYAYYNQRLVFAAINAQHKTESHNKKTEYKSLRQRRQQAEQSGPHVHGNIEHNKGICVKFSVHIHLLLLVKLLYYFEKYSSVSDRFIFAMLTVEDYCFLCVYSFSKEHVGPSGVMTVGPVTLCSIVFKLIKL